MVLEKLLKSKASEDDNFHVEEALGRLSVAQKIKLLTGLGWWHTEPIPQHGVPSVRMSDGPNGVRGTRFFNGVPSNCFPSSTGLGSSFDIDLAQRIGVALGDESKAKGVHILLGPTVNTQRSPLGGRGFESFSEDPQLNGLIAAAYVKGLQSTGVAATIKHFAANDQEYQRYEILSLWQSIVSERALREIYFKPFQIAIREANPWAVMTAYNRVNGLHCSENPWLIEDVLRGEWGWSGLVMSDWIGTYSTAESIKAGLDLEMPGPSVVRGSAVNRALIGEKLFIEDIDARVRNILGIVKRAHESKIPFDAPELTHDTPETRQILREAASSTIVLLKNDKSLLPLAAQTKTLAIIGPNAKVAMISGGGSAALRPHYTVSPLEGLAAAGKELGIDVKYSLGAFTLKYLPLVDPYIALKDGSQGALFEFWNEAPSGDFLETHPELNKELPKEAWSTPTASSYAFLADGVDDTKVNEVCYLRYSTIFTPDEDGDWDFGLTISGRGNFFFDGKVAIELSKDPKQGDAFFGLGTIDARTKIKDLKAGQHYPIEIRISNSDFISRGAPFFCRGGIRLGAAKHVEEDVALEEAKVLAKNSDAVILVVGLNHDFESEGFDREHMKLPGGTDKLVAEILKCNSNTIVVNQSGTPVEMPWVDEAHTILQAFYGGNELGNGLADVIFGKVNPSAKLSLTFPKRLEDNPSYPSYGIRNEVYGKVLYNEGIYVGYRGYEVKKVEPLFPFGYGLSYTAFEYSNLTHALSGPDSDTLSVTFTIRNIGKRSGREAAQVYISDLESALPRPVKELKGFTKVELLPGESQTVTVKLDNQALTYWDEKKQAWVAEQDKFEVLVGASSADIRLRSVFELERGFTRKGL
ncbi:glycoside hydrolase family 3 protein [Panus rudis PR-1116 ss-1]|nr:glycoside hydrolase family 3 protein [Panus rudis PR-1116 ss-1]